MVCTRCQSYSSPPASRPLTTPWRSTSTRTTARPSAAWGGTALHPTGHRSPHLHRRRRFHHAQHHLQQLAADPTARYQVRDNWSAYAQFAEGSIIPPSNVFDVPNGQVLTPPKPTLAKTYQIGSVLKFRRWTLDADAYYVHFQNGYDSYTDPVSLEASVFVATGPTNTKGLETESNIVIGWGFTLYLNGSLGSAKYQTGPNIPNGGLWVANTPKYVEAVSLLWRHKNWDVGLVDMRVGTMYNDNGTFTYLVGGIKIPYPVDQAITINPFNLVNVFVNYTMKNASFLRGSKIGLAVNNLADSHNIVGVTPLNPATATVPYAQNAGDLLNLLPGRSVMVTFTAGYAPRR